MCIVVTVSLLGRFSSSLNLLRQNFVKAMLFTLFITGAGKIGGIFDQCGDDMSHLVLLLDARRGDEGEMYPKSFIAVKEVHGSMSRE